MYASDSAMTPSYVCCFFFFLPPPSILPKAPTIPPPCTKFMSLFSFFFFGALTSNAFATLLVCASSAAPSPPGTSTLSINPANPAATALSGSAIASASAFLYSSSPKSSVSSLATFFLPTSPKLSSDLTPDLVSGLWALGFRAFIIGDGDTAPPSASLSPEFWVDGWFVSLLLKLPLGASTFIFVSPGSPLSPFSPFSGAGCSVFSVSSLSSISSSTSSSS